MKDETYTRVASGWWHALERVLTSVEGRSTKEMLRTATEVIAGRLGERGSCILFGAEPVILVSTEAPAVEGRTFQAALYPEVVAAAQSRKPLFCEDVRLEACLDSVRHLLPSHVASLAAVPIVVSGTCYGVYLIRSAEVRTMTIDDREIASAVARLSATLATMRGFLSRDATLVHRHATPVAGLMAGALRDAVLVVEDDADTRTSICDVLQAACFDVFAVAGGEPAVEIAMLQRPVAVLLDVNLPDISGFEVARRLAADPRTAPSAIVYMSGSSDLPTRVRQFSRNQDDVLCKPFTSDELLVRVRHVVAEVRRRADLNRDANTDELTGLGNLRLLRSRLRAEESRTARYRTTISVVVADLDGLKNINDRHGHMTGSDVIRRVGTAFKKEARESDLVVRYGGDEYVALLPHTGLEEASRFAGRVLERVRSLDFGAFRVTASLGVASHAPGIDRSLDDTVARADAAAYIAKRAGGNRVHPDSHPIPLGPSDRPAYTREIPKE